jgi:hypothetical protein
MIILPDNNTVLESVPILSKSSKISSPYESISDSSSGS